MDWINWSLLAMALGALWIWMGRNKDKPNVQSTLHPETRAQAKPLIPPSADGAQQDWFELLSSPLAIRPSPPLMERWTTQPQLSGFHPAIRDALWVQQRSLLQRLESELEIGMQAEIGEHFAVAGPSNQPGQLLERTLKDAQEEFARLVQLLELQPPLRLWMGRALVLLLSNRKLFDHTAWLSKAPPRQATSGAFVIGRDHVILIGIYGTRLGGFGRTLSHQVTRAVLHCLGGRCAAYPCWMEEGLARWVESNYTQPTAAPTTQPADPTRLFDDKAWDPDHNDADAIEALGQESRRVIDWLLSSHRPQFWNFLRIYKTSANEDDAWREAAGCDRAELLNRMQSEKQNA